MHSIHILCSVQPVLKGIISGEVESDLHRIYMSGTTKEQQNLKMGKCGPIKHWPAKKVSGCHVRSGYVWHYMVCSISGNYPTEHSSPRDGR